MIYPCPKCDWPLTRIVTYDHENGGKGLSVVLEKSTTTRYVCERAMCASTVDNKT